MQIVVYIEIETLPSSLTAHISFDTLNATHVEMSIAVSAVVCREMLSAPVIRRQLLSSVPVCSFRPV